MSSIEQFLQSIRTAIFARTVRNDIANAIEQCYDDVSNPTLKTEAIQAAVQAKIDAGQMAALTIGDRTITAAKLALGVIPTPDNTLSQSGTPADAKAVGDAISGVNESLQTIIGETEPVTLHLTAEGTNSDSYNRHLFAELNIISGNTYVLDFTFTECHFKNRDSARVFQVATATEDSYQHLVDTITTINDSYNAQTAQLAFKATGNATHLYVYCYTSLNSAIDITVTAQEVRTLSEIGDVYDIFGKSIFGLPMSFQFDPTYNYSSTSRKIGTYTLTAGTYVLMYHQDEGAKPNNLNTRCTPWYKTPGGSNVFMDSSASAVSLTPTDRYWVINLDTTGEYNFYFWWRLVTPIVSAEWVHISNIQLYKLDNVKGTLYASIAQKDVFDEVPFSYVSMFQKIGCVGNSWTAGSIYESDNVWAGTLNNLSWCKNAERITGSQFIQYAKGGLSARTWMDDMHGKIAVESTPACPLYIVNLGINDASELTDGTITLGQVDDFENEVSGTFFYYYGAVIDCIQTHAPNAKIILETILTRSAQQVVVRNAIIEFAEHYEIPYVDMYADPFYRSDFMTANIVGGHPTAAAHAGMAMANLRLYAKCIKDNPMYFKLATQLESGDFSLIGIADSIGRNFITSPVFYNRGANTTHSADSFEIGRGVVKPGKYILKWTQTTATLTGSNSRCTPLYNFVGDSTKRYFDSGSSFTNVTAGTYRWVFEVSTEATIILYFWAQNLSEAFRAYDFDLYRYDSVRGRLDRLEGLID